MNVPKIFVTIKYTLHHPIKVALKFIVAMDVGVFLSRLSLIVPILVATRAISDTAAFGQFSINYHTALFVANIALYGGHEAYLINRGAESKVGLFDILISAVLLSAICFAGEFVGFLEFSLQIFVFAIFVRSFFLYFITQYRFSAKEYAFLLGGLTGTLISVVLLQRIDFVTLIPLAITYLALGLRDGLLRPRLAVQAVRSYWRRRVSNVYYSANHLLSSMYVQGALFVYTFFATVQEYAVMTHFIYIFGAVALVQNLHYRVRIADFAHTSRSITQILYSSIGIAFTIAIIAAFIISIFVNEMEMLIFGISRLDGSIVWFLVGTLVAHSFNFVWGAYFIGTGRVKIQFNFTIATATFLIGVLIVLSVMGVTNALAPTFLVTTLLASLARYIAVRTTLTKSMKSSPQRIVPA